MSPPLALLARNDNQRPEITVCDLLVEWGRLTPHRVALADPASPRVWTYETLRDDAAILAVALLSRYSPGERIAIWAHPCPDGVLLQFAAAFAGLVLVKIDPAWRCEDMVGIIEDSGCVGLFMISRGRLWPGVDAKPPRRLRETVDLGDRRTLFAKHRRVDGFPEVRPCDLAQIHFPAEGLDSPAGGGLLHHHCAAALRAAHDRLATLSGVQLVGRAVA